MTNELKKFSLLLGDFIVLYLALYLTLLLRYLEQPSQELWAIHFWPFTIVFFAWILIFYISDLYNLHLAVNNSKFFQLTGRSLAIAGLLSIAFFYIIPQITIAPKRNMLIYVVVFAVLFFLWRHFYNWTLGSYLPKNNILIIGFNGQVRGLVNTLEKKPHLGWKITKIIHKESIKDINVPIATDFSEIKKIIKQEKISTVILASDLHESPQLRSSLFSSLSLKINIVSLPNFYEEVTGRIPIEAINEMWFLENLSEGKKSLFNFSKRTYDFVLAFLILIITAIFWPLIGIIIKLDSRGPIFFKQIRSGKNNRTFTIVKFRTMTIDNNDQTLTKEKDSRITGFGNFLRKTRIDEIPQVLNILAGDMSFVGPRPERPKFIKELEKQIPFYKERMLVKPGLTGWDQISGEYHSPTYEDTMKKLQYDLFYIKNRSIYLDLSIILKTIATVLSSGGI